MLKNSVHNTKQLQNKKDIAIDSSS